MSDIGPDWVAKFYKSILELDQDIDEFRDQVQSVEEDD